MLNGFAATTFDHHLLLLCTSPHSETIHPFHLLIDWFEHHGSSSIWDGVLCIIIASKSAQACSKGETKLQSWKWKRQHIQDQMDLGSASQMEKRQKNLFHPMPLWWWSTIIVLHHQSRSTILWRFSWMFYSENCCYKELWSRSHNLQSR